MPDLPLGLFRTLIKFQIENGLAIADNDATPIVAGEFRSLYERDAGHINSSNLAGISTDSAITDYIKRTPGKYTGEMRKVVQCLLSTGDPVQYEYKFSKTHGVSIAPDGERFVIEISSAGVFAITIQKNGTTYPDHNFLGYTPKYVQGFSADIQANGVQLLTSADMLPFYSKISFFDSCGWAFNGDGSIASNTCYEDVNGDLTAFVYDIAISFDVNNNPSATITQSESGRFKFNTNKGVKLPDSTEQTLIPFLANTGTDFSGSATIYVFYDGQEKIKTKAFLRGYQNIGYNDVNPPGWVSYGVTFPNKVSYYNGQIYRSGYEEVSGANGCYVSNKFSETRNATGNITSYKYILEVKDGWTGTDGAAVAYDTSYKNTVDRESRSLFTDIEDSFCIIPLGDREAVYQFERKESTATYWTNQVTVNNSVLSGSYCELVSVNVNGQTCKQANACFTASTDSLQKYDTFITDPLNLGDIVCTFNYVANDISDTTITKNGTTEVTADLYLVASGGIKQLILSDPTITRVNRFNDEIYNQQMFVYKDSSSNEYFCSDDVNSISGAGYYVSALLDTVKYPVQTFGSGIYRFFIGDP